MFMYDETPMHSPLEDNWGLNRAQWWKLKLCWAPKKCFLSGKSLWGKYAYCGENWITGPDDPVVEKYWIAKDEFIIWQLKKG
jgi:hypothetical protein